MKLLFGVILGVCMLQTVFTLPAKNSPADDAEYIVVPLEKQAGPVRRPFDVEDDNTDFHNFKGVIDTESGTPFFSLAPYNPFRWNLGFFDNFEDVFKRIHESVAKTFSRIPQPGSDDWPIDESNENAKGNTTSTVKIIGDHKVIINDTVYSKKGDFGNSFFKVRTVNVVPLDQETEGDAVTVDNGSPSTVTEGIFPNLDEDDKGSPEIIEKNVKDNNIERNIDSNEPSARDEKKNIERNQDTKLKNDAYFPNQQVESLKIETHASKNIKTALKSTLEKPMRISTPSDTEASQKIKQTEMESSEEEDTNVEDNESAGSAPYFKEWDYLDDSAPVDHNVNDIDIYESVPIDLSNDIAVNQIAADRGVPYNTDAEFISPPLTQLQFVPYRQSGVTAHQRFSSQYPHQKQTQPMRYFHMPANSQPNYQNFAPSMQSTSFSYGQSPSYSFQQQQQKHFRGPQPFHGQTNFPHSHQQQQIPAYYQQYLQPALSSSAGHQMPQYFYRPIKK